MVKVTIALHRATLGGLAKETAPGKVTRQWESPPVWTRARVTARTPDRPYHKSIIPMCPITVKLVAAIRENLHTLINLARQKETMEVQVHRLFQHLWYRTTWQGSYLHQMVKSTQTADRGSRLTQPTRTEKAAYLKLTRPQLPIMWMPLTPMHPRLHRLCRKTMAWVQATQLLGLSNSF